MTFPVFLLYAAVGLGVGICDKALSPLRARCGKIFTVLSDIALAFCAVGLFALLMFGLNDGCFFFYAATGEAVCFFVGRALCAAVLRGFARLFRKRQKAASRP